MKLCIITQENAREPKTWSGTPKTIIEYCEKLNILFIDKTNAMAIVTKKGHCEMCIMTKKRKLWQKGCK